MSKALRAVSVGALVLAAACSKPAKSTPLPEDAKIKTLVTELAPEMKCDQPQDSKTDRSVIVACGSGTVFIEAYPDAASAQTRLKATDHDGGDVLVGDDGTWFATSTLMGGLKPVQQQLGGQLRHSPS